MLALAWTWAWRAKTVATKSFSRAESCSLGCVFTCVSASKHVMKEGHVRRRGHRHLDEKQGMSPGSRGLQTDAIVGKVFSSRELAGFFGLGTCDSGGLRMLLGVGYLSWSQAGGEDLGMINQGGVNLFLIKPMRRCNTGVCRGEGRGVEMRGGFSVLRHCDFAGRAVTAGFYGEEGEAEFSEHLLTLCQACQGSSGLSSRFCPVLAAGPASEVRSQLLTSCFTSTAKTCHKETFNPTTCGSQV